MENTGAWEPKYVNKWRVTFERLDGTKYSTFHDTFEQLVQNVSFGVDHEGACKFDVLCPGTYR
jgi:hypothetical protein